MQIIHQRPTPSPRRNKTSRATRSPPSSSRRIRPLLSNSIVETLGCSYSLTRRVWLPSAGLVALLWGAFTLASTNGIEKNFGGENKDIRITIEATQASVDVDAVPQFTDNMLGDFSSPDFSVCPFNYTAYWNHALNLALSSLRKEESLHLAPRSSSPCPKVFVYDLTPELTDSPSESSIAKVFGRKDEEQKEYKVYSLGGQWTSQQYTFPSILEYRLRNSEQCRTLDPEEADLFFVPILTAPKAAKSWRRACEKIKANTLIPALPYLDSSNACRHFFALGKGHYNGKACSGWFANPIEELAPSFRLAYSHFDFDIDERTGEHSRLASDTETKAKYPNLVSVPYPSSVHFWKNTDVASLPQFSNAHNRTVLMSFVGEVFHGDTQVRRNIIKMCEGYSDYAICRGMVSNSLLSKEKSKAVFCLEPAGDSPWRKGLSDSITLGCIPVLFSDLTDDVAPFHWKSWKDRSRVLIPRKAFVSGCVDLKTLLQSAPPQLVNLMQRTLREKARMFQYSVNDDQEDGIRIILDGLLREASQRCPRVETE